MQRFLTGIAHSVVEAQCALDKRGEESILRWEQERIPSNTFMWSRFQLAIPVALQCRARSQAGDEIHFMLAPRMASKSNLKLVFRYLPRLQDEDMQD